MFQKLTSGEGNKEFKKVKNWLNKSSNANLFALLGFVKNAEIADTNEVSKAINWFNCSLVIGTDCGFLQQSAEKQSNCSYYDQNNHYVSFISSLFNNFERILLY